MSTDMDWCRLREFWLVSRGGEPDAVRAIWTALDGSRVVSSVVLGGSRARGTATELSDWDLYLEGDPDRLMAEIPGLVASLAPLAAFWDPLPEQVGYMVVMNGPIKVDLFPIGASRPMQPPWVLGVDSLVSIDGHFWDWTLWLGAKALRGERQRVADELAKMHRFLLAPIGVAATPASLDEAVASYQQARAKAMDTLEVSVNPELGRQVSQTLQRHGLLAKGLTH
jgi:nucleotidyltransferase-like protein